MAEIHLLFTIDVDNDGVTIQDERTALRWTGVARIPDIKEVCNRLGLRATWFVRADSQLQQIYGSAKYLLLEYAPLWGEMERSGDEIAWHPHLYEWDNGDRRYVMDTDADRCVRKLEAARAELVAGGFRHATVRIGEAFQCNAMMAALARLALEVDSTAIPGRKRADASRTFDWGPTPNGPYRPSKADYRLPGSDSHLDILEVPMTTVPIKAPSDPAPLPRYLNPAYCHPAFKAGLDAHLESLSGQSVGDAFLTLILHPDEVVPEGRSHPLYAFSLQEVEQNLKYTLRAIESHGLEWRSICMRDVPALWSARGDSGARA